MRVKLYVRGSKEFQPTAAGRRLCEYAEKIVDLSNQMHKELSVTDEDNMVVRVGLIELVTLSWLPRFLQEIRAQPTMIQVEIISETSANLVGALRRDEIDMAFVWGPAHELNIENEYICSYALGWMGSPELWDVRKPLDVVDLARLPLVRSKKEASDRSIVREYFAAYGVQESRRPDDRVTLSSYSLATSQQLIRTGLGVMAMAPLLMADDIDAGRAVVLPVKQNLPPAYLTACHKSLGAPPYVAKLVEMARLAANEYAKNVNPTHFWV